MLKQQGFNLLFGSGPPAGTGQSLYRSAAFFTSLTNPSKKAVKKKFQQNTFFCLAQKVTIIVTSSQYKNTETGETKKTGV